MDDLPMVDVLIVGAGPTGLTAAIAARKHGLSVRIIDRNAERTPYSKALVLHSRSMEVFDDLECIEPILARGRVFRALNVRGPQGTIARIQFDQLDWNDAPYPMWFTIPQSATEEALEVSLSSLGVSVEREHRALELVQHEGFVEVEVTNARNEHQRIRAAWVLGCDGARSDVRRMLDVALDGATMDDVFLLADVGLTSSLTDAEGYNVLARDGVLLIVPLEVPGQVRLIAHMPTLRPDDAPVIDQAYLQRLIDERCPVPAKVTSVGWTSHFTPKHLLARNYRVGRVFLAGDAAHLHSPVGGQGLNTGIQDAYNLLWKLSLAHRSLAAPGLLHTYEFERRSVADAMIHSVARATRMLLLRNPYAQRVRNRMGRTMFSLPFVRNRMGPNVGMLHLQYPPSDAVAREELRPLQNAPRAGSRAPMLASVPAFSKELRGTQHTLLLFHGTTRSNTNTSEVCATAQRICGEQVHIVHVLSSPRSLEATTVNDDDGTLHKAYGITEPLAVWIRPDKYIGFRGSLREPHALASYLHGIFKRS